MAEDVVSILKNKQITVFVLDPQDFSSHIQTLTKSLVSLSKTICYVSLNKPGPTIKSDLEKIGVSTEKIYFVDAVSSKVGSTSPDKNVLMVSSPNALTELSIAINKGIGLWKADVVLFDSLSTLLVYEGTSSILKFVHSMTNNLRVKGLSCVFTILKQDLKEELAKDLGMFADMIGELG